MGKELALKDQWSQYADEAAEAETQIGAQWIRTSSGVLQFGDDPLPGNRMCVVVVDSLRENTFYPERYNSEDIQPPTCYAFGRDDEMEPAVELMDQTDPKEEWFEPQADACDGCPLNEWGSSDTGRGKACQNRRRLAVIPAGVYVKNKKSKELELELFDDEEHFEEADMAFVKVPVTSVKNWSKFVQKCSSAHRRPPFGVVAEVWLEPDSKSQYKMQFEIIEEVPDHLASIIMDRHEEAKKIIATPYRPPMEEAKPSARGGLKGLKKKGKR